MMQPDLSIKSPNLILQGIGSWISSPRPPPFGRCAEIDPSVPVGKSFWRERMRGITLDAAKDMLLFTYSVVDFRLHWVRLFLETQQAVIVHVSSGQSLPTPPTSLTELVE